ncbi:hypothetical protein E2C01_072562 [Portunus trituberculatus]|uniref:Uncharacterized protein n=1 Tax=Portunus trituberculatus TaxID=210409 RepID=A0A5B7I9A2_PORTR|nr:hypothetical protein [Portunus trituberculatus]
MFAWWISWLWAWMLWSCMGGVGALWTEGIDPEDLLGPEGIDTIDIDVEGVHVGPGMGGSAIQIMGGEPERAQRFATQPTPQTAVIGSTVVLPCSAQNNGKVLAADTKTWDSHGSLHILLGHPIPSPSPHTSCPLARHVSQPCLSSSACPSSHIAFTLQTLLSSKLVCTQHCFPTIPASDPTFWIHNLKP